MSTSAIESQRFLVAVGRFVNRISNLSVVEMSGNSDFIKDLVTCNHRRHLSIYR